LSVQRSQAFLRWRDCEVSPSTRLAGSRWRVGLDRRHPGCRSSSSSTRS
jgi:hypothetical protein